MKTKKFKRMSCDLGGERKQKFNGQTGSKLEFHFRYLGSSSYRRRVDELVRGAERSIGHLTVVVLFLGWMVPDLRIWFLIYREEVT